MKLISQLHSRAGVTARVRALSILSHGTKLFRKIPAKQLMLLSLNVLTVPRGSCAKKPTRVSGANSKWIASSTTVGRGITFREVFLLPTPILGVAPVHGASKLCVRRRFVMACLRAITSSEVRTLTTRPLTLHRGGTAVQRKKG